MAVTATKPGKRVAEGIYWQADGSLSIRFSTGRRRPGKASYEYYTETFHGSVKDAIARRAKLITEFAEGRLKPPERKKTFGEYCLLCFDYNQQRVSLGKIAASTAEFYERTMRRNFMDLWETPLAKVTARHVLTVFARLVENGRTPDYVQSVYRAFRAVWSTSRRLKINVPDILDDVSEMLPPAVPKRRVILQPAECKRLLLAAKPNPITHAILVCLLHTGMRISECLGLRWSDVDFDRAELIIEQQALRKPDSDGHRTGPHKTYKTHGPRVLRLTPTLAGELKRLRPILAAMRLKAGDRWQDYDLCFPTSVGTPYQYNTWETRYWVPLFKTAGVPRIRVHDLRHSIVTFLLSEGVPVSIVQEIAGHADLETTMDYKHLLVNAQDEAMAKLDLALRE